MLKNDVKNIKMHKKLLTLIKHIFKQKIILIRIERATLSFVELAL